MTAEERKARRDARAAQTAVCDECNLTGAHAEGCSKRPAAPQDLSNPATQKAILDPVPIPVTIGGEAVRLYPLPAYEQCDLSFSFMPRLAKASLDLLGPIPQGTPIEAVQNAVSQRYTQALVEHKDLREQLTHFIARSEYEPAADPTDDELALRAKLVYRTMAPMELLAVFTELLQINELSPKQKAPAQ